MLVLALALALPLDHGGTLGDSSQAGKLGTANVTLHGPKPLVSNSLFSPLLRPSPANSTSSYMATTLVLWRAGEVDDTGTKWSMLFSNKFTISLMTCDSLLMVCLSNSFLANPTQQIPCQEASMAQSACSFLQYPSLSTFKTLSSTLMTHSLQLKSPLSAMGDIPLRLLTTLTTLDESRKSKSTVMLYSSNMTSSSLNPSATSIPTPSHLPKHP